MDANVASHHARQSCLNFCFLVKSLQFAHFRRLKCLPIGMHCLMIGYVLLLFGVSYISDFADFADKNRNKKDHIQPDFMFIK